jgi:glycosyltransferase involved in cell wall biosynthesis
VSPAVSVLMPVRDVADTVAAAARSILDGDHSDLELLIVDDGSTDDTAARLAELAAADGRVRILSLGGPEGIVAALNRGLAAARARWLARMDGDDLAAPERLSTQLAFLADHPEIGVCDSRVHIFRDDGPTGGGYRSYQRWLDGIETHGDFEREMLIENPVVHPAVVASTELLRRVGGYRDGPFPEDYDLWLRCARAGARFHKLPQRLLSWRDHGRRLTRTDRRYARSAFVPLKWEHLLATRLRPGLRVAVWGAGPAARPWLRALSRSECELAAVFDIDPAKIGNPRQGVTVRPVEEVEEAEFDLLLVAVGARGARALIRERLVRTSLAEPADYLFVA